MKPSTVSSYRPYAFGGLYYLVLLVLALIFYKDRSFFADLPYHIFHLLHNEGYAIQNQRFGAFLTQTPPLLALQLGASLKTVALVYSATFALFYGGIFGLLVALKQARWAAVLLLLSSLMVADTFFWIQSELPQGLAVMLLTFGLMNRATDWAKWRAALLLLPLLVTLVYFHPLLFIPFTFVGLFLYGNAAKYGFDRRLLLGSLGAFWLIFMLKNTLLRSESAYESKTFLGLYNFIDLFPNYFLFANSGAFFSQLLTPALAVVVLLLLYHYTQNQTHSKYQRLLVLGGVLGYWLLITVSYARTTFLNHYMENLYLPLSILVGVPLVFEVLPTLPRRVVQWIWASILILAVVRIVSHRTPYSQRRYWQRDLLAQTAQLPQKKLLIPATAVPKDTLLGVFWSSPFEFWLLSNIERPDEPPRSILLDDGSMPLEKLLEQYPHHFATYWSQFSYETLNCTYFDCTDSSYYVQYVPR